jgi:polyhydroxybutyrate depolymerase
MLDRMPSYQSVRRSRANTATSDLVPGTLTVDGIDRTFLLHPAPRPARPLVMVLHGGGGQARGIVGLTDMARRGEAAGFATVFPNGINRGWNDGRTGARLARRAGLDDARFLVGLIDHLVQQGVADGRAIFVCGMSNGAFMSDHLARVAPDRVAGIGLVAGTAGVRAVVDAPLSTRPIPVLLFHGDADPIVPYAGGPVGLHRAHPRRRAARRVGPTAGLPTDPTDVRGVGMGADQLAADWARVDGCPPMPTVERLTPPTRDLGVVRLTWTSPTGVRVILHRIEGGGHTWPGGPQYLPSTVIGPVATTLDATGILLDHFAAIADQRGAPR